MGRTVWSVLAGGAALTLLTLFGWSRYTARTTQASQLIVFAAASLTEPFQALAKENPGSLAFNFGGTNQLRLQLEEGAAGDVFASASTEEMRKAVAAGLVSPPVIFAHNQLVLVVPRANPAKLKELRDLGKSGLKLVVAHPDVPVGAYTHQLLETLAKTPGYGPAFSQVVKKNIISLELNVKQVLVKVRLGEADAGIVYNSDVSSTVAPDITEITIPAAVNITADYPVAVLSGAHIEMRRNGL